jgi:hypothetical protein
MPDVAQDDTRGHKLFPDSVADDLPGTYAQDGKGGDATAYVKLFASGSRLTYFVTGYDPDERLLSGYIVSPLGPDGDEFGTASLDELAALQVGRIGGLVERDLYFEPTSVFEAVGALAESGVAVRQPVGPVNS